MRLWKRGPATHAVLAALTILLQFAFETANAIAYISTHQPAMSRETAPSLGVR